MRVIVIGNRDQSVMAAIEIAKTRGANVSHVPDVEAALQSLRDGKGADLIMIDANIDVALFVKQTKAEHIVVPTVAYGLENDVSGAVNAIKAGVKEYIPLPPDEDLIAAVLEAITEEQSEMIATAPVMEKFMQMVDQISASEASVLITGESGTGKEIMARYIHTHSKRAKNDMISVNCAAIPDNLLESELFGHEKGAFTGALTRRIGKFEEANGSTLLLDEISEMDLRLQAKLLRAIQEREIDRVGGSKPVKVDIRIVATSNRNLLEEVQAGNFREDLFFRLNVIQLQLPPLRDRKEDIPLFAKHFITKFSKLNGLPEKPMAQDALQKLMLHQWPGNVRELENTIHRAVLLATGDTISAEAIVLTAQADNDNQDAVLAGQQEASNMVGKTVAAVEKDLIMNTLDHCLGNRTHAANILGISIRTLRNKLHQYDQEKAAQ